MSTLISKPYNGNIPQQNEFKKKLQFSGLKDDREKGSETSWKEGQRVYVRDPQAVWAKATVTEVLQGHLVVSSENKTYSAAFHDVVLRPTDDDFVGVSDLTAISPLSAPAVLECLCWRYGRSEVYTWAGQTLVALNPFEDLPHLYGTEAISAYHRLHEEATNKVTPHVYGVAARAHNNMRCRGFQPNQSIIVSGESGAGKTVSARHLMKYLVTVANHSPIGQKNMKREESFGCEIERRILNSNPILEAFGNAATLRNENSSRFGKYIEIQFDRFGHVSGATIQTYLLEKTRVVHQPAGEGTFHIFYQMLAALGAERRQELGLSEELLQDASQTSREAEALSQWEQTQEALTSLRVSRQHREHLLQILSAILLLNRVEITEDEEDEDVCCITDTPENQALATKAADLLQVDLGALEKSFTHRRITASHARRRSVFSRPCTAPEAAARRDCLGKLLYQQVFEWLVSVINHSIHTTDVHTTIGLLDIYGFESFAVNSLEQLCINYANERLQQHYVTHFLRDLQAEYQQEAIGWADVVFIDNRPCLNLLEGAPGPGATPGLFALINEECQVNRPDGDQGVCDRLLGALGSVDGSRQVTPKGGHSPPGRLGTPRQTRPGQPAFVVTHYAGPVTYSGIGLLDKNKDNIPPELLEVMQSSSNPFITELFGQFEPDNPGKKKKTVLAKFKSSLDQLMTALNQTQPHYIRCIKPNASSSPRAQDPAYVYEQLAASGIVETVEVNRKGYPTRIPYEKFLQHYSLILRSLPDEVPAAEDKENELLFDPLDVLYQKQLRLTPRRRHSTTPKRRLRRRAVEEGSPGLSSCDHTRKLAASILSTVFGQRFAKSPASVCQFGITKLFLRDGKLEQLESVRLQCASTHAFTIQCAWHRYQRRRRIRRNRAATLIQAAWRGKTEQVKYQHTIKAVIRLQRAVRHWITAQRTQKLTAKTTTSPGLSLHLDDSYTGPASSSDGERGTSPSEFFTPSGRLSPAGGEEWEYYHTPACHTAVRSNSRLLRAEDTSGSSPLLQGRDTGDSAFASDANLTLREADLNTPTNRPTPGRAQEDGVLLYSSPRSAPATPLALPTFNIKECSQEDSTTQEQEAFVVCEEQEEDGGTIYHIVRSPHARAGERGERAGEVVRRVAASISATCLSRWRFSLAGAFTGIPYLEAQGGVLSRRRMPRVQIKFHTRANPLLQGAHYISHQEFQCSLTDCLN